MQLQTVWQSEKKIVRHQPKITITYSPRKIVLEAHTTPRNSWVVLVVFLTWGCSPLWICLIFSSFSFARYSFHSDLASCVITWDSRRPPNPPAWRHRMTVSLLVLKDYYSWTTAQHSTACPAGMHHHLGKVKGGASTLHAYIHTWGVLQYILMTLVVG